MVLSIIFLEDKHKILLHLSIFTLTPHGKKMHVKEIYVIFIHLFDSGILLIIDLNKKKKGG
jgi:DNA repair protein RadC